MLDVRSGLNGVGDAGIASLDITAVSFTAWTGGFSETGGLIDD